MLRTYLFSIRQIRDSYGVRRPASWQNSRRRNDREWGRPLDSEPSQAQAIAFAGTYADACGRFLGAAYDCAEIASWQHPLCGPAGESLAVDCAWLGPPAAPSVVVVVSGTHGVEGFSGSGIQVDLLLRGVGRLPPETALLLIHGLNPWGFAWLRRVNEDGVDLNRNFVDFDDAIPSNPLYPEIAAALVPAALDADTLTEDERLIERFRAKHGEAVFQFTRKAGQYVDPQGVFFGGTAPAWSRTTLAAIADRFRLAGRQSIATIDVHTGLGPFGYGEIILKNAPESATAARCRQWFGRSLTEPARGTSSTPRVHGSASNFWTNLGPPLAAFVVLEYGTFGPEQGRLALRDDHWLHKHGIVDWNDATTRRIKARLKEHYHPGTADWNEMVLWRGRQVIRQALDGVSGAGG